MDITMSGDYPTIPRRRTGLLSFDMAVAKGYDLGMPLRTTVELYGYPNVGKSTFAYYLGGSVATPSKHMAICDLELADTDYIPKAVSASGFKGEVRMVDILGDKGKPLTHESVLMKAAALLADDEYGSLIVDSVGAIQPQAEAEGDFGEAFMGKRAKLVAQMSRAISGALRNKETPSTAIVINHVHSVMGGRGHNTAGGETLKYLSQVRIMLWTGEVFANDDGSALGFLVEGRVEKLRYGGRGREFQFYIVPQYGVHVGASAMFDCFTHGMAERDKSGRVKIDGKSLGYIKANMLTYAAEGKSRKFEPFIEAAASYKYEPKKVKDED